MRAACVIAIAACGGSGDGGTPVTVHELPMVNKAADHVAVAPDGALLAAATLTLSQELWRLDGGAWTALTVGEDDSVTGVGMHRDGRILIGTDSSKGATLWELGADGTTTALATVPTEQSLTSAAPIGLPSGHAYIGLGNSTSLWREPGVAWEPAPAHNGRRHTASGVLAMTAEGLVEITQSTDDAGALVAPCTAFPEPRAEPCDAPFTARPGGADRQRFYVSSLMSGALYAVDRDGAVSTIPLPDDVASARAAAVPGGVIVAVQQGNRIYTLREGELEFGTVETPSAQAPFLSITPDGRVFAISNGWIAELTF